MLEENKELFNQVNEDIMDGLEEFTTRLDLTKGRVKKSKNFKGLFEVLANAIGWGILLGIIIFTVLL